MNSVCYRFYAELNDFLAPERRGRAFCLPLKRRASVKDAIEALGVPHTEVDLILVNGESVGFEHRVAPGDRVSVYPVFESLDVGPATRVRPQPLRVTRFVLDGHLGRLAAYLRMLGFDTLYDAGAADEELARLSGDEGRILLTRDRGLLKRSMVTHGYCVRSEEPREQLLEVVRRFDLSGSLRPLTRCLRCNGALQPVAKEEVAHLLEPRTLAYYTEFHRCQTCGRVYWPGSHLEHMRALIASATAPDAREEGG